MGAAIAFWIALSTLAKIRHIHRRYVWRLRETKTSSQTVSCSTNVVCPKFKFLVKFCWNGVILDEILLTSSDPMLTMNSLTLSNNSFSLTSKDKSSNADSLLLILFEIAFIVFHNFLLSFLHISFWILVLFPFNFFK